MDAFETVNQRICPRVPLPSNSVLMDSCGHEYGVVSGNISVSGCGLSFESETGVEDLRGLTLKVPVAGKFCSLHIDCLRHSKEPGESMEVAGHIHDVGLHDYLFLCKYINEHLRQEAMRSVFYDGINFKAAF